METDSIGKTQMKMYSLKSQCNTLSNITLSKVICDNADDITTIIPKAFETGQEEQSCDSLPSLELGHWRDTC